MQSLAVITRCCGREVLPAALHCQCTCLSNAVSHVFQYACRQALADGLHHDQVIRVQAFAEQLRSGADDDDRGQGAVAQGLRKRVALLEDRLAKALAFRDLPKHMRGATCCPDAVCGLQGCLRQICPLHHPGHHIRTWLSSSTSWLQEVLWTRCSGLGTSCCSEPFTCILATSNCCLLFNVLTQHVMHILSL